MRDFARISGIIWMAVAGVGGLFGLSRFSSTSHYWGANGFREAITMSIIFALPGYLLYRWGSKGQKNA